MAEAKNTTRRTRRRAPARSLDVEIQFLEGLVRRDPEYVEAWEVLGDDYLESGRTAEGLQVDERLCQLLPVDSRARYNLACSLSLNGHLDAAVSELDRALDLGFRDFPHLARDPELDAIRKHPNFQKIRAKIRALKTAKF